MVEPLTPEEEKAIRERHYPCDCDTARGAGLRAGRKPEPHCVLRTASWQVDGRWCDAARLLATLDAERALHPVSDATPDLAAALRAIVALPTVVPDHSHGGVHPPYLEWTKVRAIVDAALASEPVPATCIGCDFTGNTAAVSYINPKCPVHGTVPATGNPEGQTADPFEWECGDIHCPHHGIARSATGNPEGIDAHHWVAALGSVAPDDLQVCAHPGCKAARSLSEVARQREGERP